MSVAQAIASAVARPASLSNEQRIFEAALQLTKSKLGKDGAVPPFFDILRHAQTVADLQYALDSVKTSNRFWSEDSGKKWLKNISKFAERILVYKGLLSSVASTSESC